jgi:hypothetical protein
MNPIKLTLRHWRFLAPTWLMPMVLMLFIVIKDIFGTQVIDIQWLPVIIFPVMLVSTFLAGLLQRRERLPWIIFYLIWLTPMMVVWCSLVIIRATILTTLGRPL